MHIHLHVGLDKAGSTAIQGHVFHNRDWFHRRQVFVPNLGLARTGHNVLFREYFPQRFDELLKELHFAESMGFGKAFISSESIHFFSESELTRLRSILQDHTLTIMLYLREQSEIIQSGYAQRLKLAPATVDLDTFSRTTQHLMPPERNYAALLQKLSVVFGRENIAIRIFERERLKDNDIVADFLHLLGLETDGEFSRLGRVSNPSLDVPAIRLLNSWDAVGGMPIEDRDGFIDLLLEDIVRRGSVEKYFLSEQQCEEIHQYYEQSNRTVVAEYFDGQCKHPELFSYTKKAAMQASPEEIDAAIERRQTLSLQLQAYSSWNGRRAEGAALGRLLPVEQGWQESRDSQVWSMVDQAAVRFRFMWRFIRPGHGQVTLKFFAVFDSEYRAVRVYLREHDLGRIDSGNQSLEFPVAFIPEYGALDIKLVAEAGPLQGGVPAPGDAQFSLHGLAMRTHA